MTSQSDLWIDDAIVWAAPSGPLRGEKHRALTHRALALAGETGCGCVMFDYRGALLTHDALARHAVWLVKADPGMTLRAALLLRQTTPDTEFWARLLWLSGVSAAVFVDAAVAVKWLQRHPESEQRGSEVTQHE